MTDAFAYLRTSTITNVAGDSETRQMLAIQRYADANAITIVQPLFWDADIKGRDLVETRPSFARMLAHINASDVRLVLVEDATRFARDIVAQELGLRMLVKLGVTVVTASGIVLTDDADPARKMIRRLLGIFGEYENDTMVARLKGGRDRASEAAGKRVEGRKANLPLWHAAKSLKASEPSLSLREVATKLADLGYISTSGRHLAPSHLRHILSA